jgi:hypothetical protein
VKKMALQSGPPGSGKVLANAGNNAGKGQTALPLGAAGALAGSHRATVQVRTSERHCFGSELPIIHQADAFLFKGILP